MKKLFFPIVALALSAMIGCTEKIKVAAPYKNITVIYGLLDQQDTAHYVRVQKAFLDNDKSAVDMAKVADSNFFRKLNVVVKRYKVLGTTNTFIDSTHLDRVDLNLEGYPKQPGVFFQSPNYAYKFKGYLFPDCFYRIVVTNLETGEKDSANAPVINDLDAAVFNVPILDDSSTNKAGMTFVGRAPFSFEGVYINPANYNFFGQKSPAAIAQSIIRFNWWDSTAGTPKKPGSVDYNLGYAPLINQSFGFSVQNQQLFYALRDGMGQAPPNTIRLLDRTDIIVYLGTPDYYNNYQVSLTQGTGLTGSEISPIYTNIQGANAIGLFTSRGTKANKIIIDKQTIDSLMHNPIMSGTNIQGTVY